MPRQDALHEKEGRGYGVPFIADVIPPLGGFFSAALALTLAAEQWSLVEKRAPGTTPGSASNESEREASRVFFFENPSRRIQD